MEHRWFEGRKGIMRQEVLNGMEHRKAEQQMHFWERITNIKEL